jgi:hypothetical protein
VHAAWSPDDARIVTTSDDKTARIHILDVDTLIEFACTRVGRNMTQQEWEHYIGRDVPYRKTCPHLPVGQ